MASKFAQKCWEIGIALNEAWEQFAPTALREKYRNLQNFDNALAEGFDPELPKSALSAFHRATQLLIEKQRAEAELKDILLTRLFNDDLIAVGYREYPSISQSPVRIDPDKFNNDDPNWRKETFAVHGIRYGRIRICDPRDLENLRDQRKRKGSIKAIDFAIDELRSIDPEFCEIPRKQACQRVRTFLRKEQKPGNGLSDQNISKALVRKCGQKGIS